MDKAINELNKNRIIIHSTNTVFGIVGKLDKVNIELINKLKNRNPRQKLQILVPSLAYVFSKMTNDDWTIDYLKRNYDGKSSYVIKTNKIFNEKYLIKEFNETAMFRIPEGEILDLVKKVGPLFATSANIHNEKPTNNVKKIKEIFDLPVYGEIESDNEPSKIISILNNKEEILRR